MKEQQKCPSCGSNNLYPDTRRGELVCKKCGSIVKERIVDPRQEWREFNFEQMESRRRVGSPLTSTRHDKGLSTTIGTRSDIQNLPLSQRRKYYRMNKWQGRISTAIERNLKFALSDLRRTSSILKLSRIVEEGSAHIYEKAARKGLVRGRSMESVVAGAIYASCRSHNVPRTLGEISAAFGLDKKEIGKTYRFICRQLGMRILPTSPMDYVYRFSSELNLNPETTTKAVEILKSALKKEITSGKGPMGIAAAALYVAALLTGQKRTQREVADVAGVTEVTIRNRYKELLEELGLEDNIKEIKDKREANVE